MTIDGLRDTLMTTEFFWTGKGFRLAFVYNTFDSITKVQLC